MKTHSNIFAALLSILAVAVCLNLNQYRVEAATAPQEPKKATSKEAAAKQPKVNMSAKPTAGDAVGQARFAWYIFLQATAPSSGPNGPLAFENWTEQCQLNPNMIGCPSTSSLAAGKKGAKRKTRTLHSSALAKKMVGGKRPL